MRLYVRLLIGLLRRSTRGRLDLLMENLVLRQQLEVYTRQPKRPRLRNEDRLFWVGGCAHLVAVALAAAVGAAGDGGPLAPHGLASVLDLEEPPARAWTSSGRS